MGEPSSSWQNFNFRDDEGSAQGMQALRLLLAKLQEAQANPCLKPSVNNLLMTEDLMLTSTQRLPFSVAPMHLEGGEGVPVMHGPMQANVVPHPLQGPLQTDGAKKKQYHGQERHVGKIREEGDFHDDDDEPPSRSRHKKRTNERRTKRSRRNSSGGSSSSSQSGRSSHGRFPKKGTEEDEEEQPSKSYSLVYVMCGAFEKRLLQEYFMEDSERVTKRTFLEWVACPKDGLSPMELLREFERCYAQSSTAEQVTLDAEKVELFLQATGSEIQENLEPLLEDESIEQGLKTEWKDVDNAVSLLAKWQCKRDKMVINNATPTLVTTENEAKSPTTSQKNDESSMLDELVKGK
ncbi:hypothetical protein L7F22_061232 [Adiantum nelumboides]|nr:hypothetical protein [Adiantum nelumboides]